MSLFSNEKLQVFATASSCAGLLGNLRQFGGLNLYIEQVLLPFESVFKKVQRVGSSQHAPHPLQCPVRPSSTGRIDVNVRLNLEIILLRVCSMNVSSYFPHTH